jgi:hypothetical protein
MAPVTIRAIVQEFKDRIASERDKSCFKALCDAHTVVVEYPVGSGAKCLALKEWLAPPVAAEAEAEDGDDGGGGGGGGGGAGGGAE